MADVQYNVNNLMESADDYRALADQIGEIKEQLGVSIAQLKDRYWVSDGGSAFMQMYEESWADMVEKYILVLQELSILLNKAAVNYMDMTEKLNDIPEVHVI